MLTVKEIGSTFWFSAWGIREKKKKRWKILDRCGQSCPYMLWLGRIAGGWLRLLNGSGGVRVASKWTINPLMHNVPEWSDTL